MRVTAYHLAELWAQMTAGVALAVKVSADVESHPRWRGRRIDEAEPKDGQTRRQ
ncbi:MAG: hypothetical protein ACRDZX_12910 [Acidimicrobiales bacterium]